MPSFIEELKKRKVFNSAAIYLATAFVILQAAQIIIPSLLIPQWTLRLLVVMPILGFPVVLVFSWIYDVGNEGFVKTDSTKPEAEDEAQPAGMKKSSLFGIFASIVITIFMIYKGVDFFTSSNKASGKISIAVLNFDNIRKFKDYDWLGERIASNLTFKLGEISQISMIDRLQILTKLGEIDPKKASVMDYKINQIAKNIAVDFILHGSFIIMDDIIEVTAFLADTNTGVQTSLLLEQYPLEELSDIPSHINNQIVAFIKTNSRFKSESK